MIPWDICPYKKRHSSAFALPALTKKDRMNTQQDGSHLQPNRRVLTRHQSCWHLDLELPISKTEKINFCSLKHPVYGILYDSLSRLRHYVLSDIVCFFIHWDFLFLIFIISFFGGGEFLVDMEELILNFICKGTGSRIGKTILKRVNKVGGISLPFTKAYLYIEASRCVTLVEWQTHKLREKRS